MHTRALRYMSMRVGDVQRLDQSADMCNVNGLTAPAANISGSDSSISEHVTGGDISAKTKLPAHN